MQRQNEEGVDVKKRTINQMYMDWLEAKLDDEVWRAMRATTVEEREIIYSFWQIGNPDPAIWIAQARGFYPVCVMIAALLDAEDPLMVHPRGGLAISMVEGSFTVVDEAIRRARLPRLHAGVM